MAGMSADGRPRLRLRPDAGRSPSAHRGAEAIGDDWDPIAVLAEEEKAYDMLYSDLDEEQQRIYDELVGAGVLPDRTVNRVAD